MDNPTPHLPALLGGPPIRPQGPPSWPGPDEEVLEALQAAYRDGSWGKYHGAYVERLEVALAAYHGVEFALTCGSGTFAVEAALQALKVGPGDEVLLAAYDYPGNFLSIHAVGARPVLVEINRDNWNLAPDRLTGALSPAARVIVVSHLHGGVVPMREVLSVAAAHGLRVIEDAAQAPGSTVQGRMAGTWGDVGTLSFGGSKVLTAGRGGALLTRHPDVAQRLRLNLLRGNHVCPLSELQAAVLLPQLTQLAAKNSHRANQVRRLLGLLAEVPGLRPLFNRASDSSPGYYKLGFQFDAEQFGGLSRARFVAAARAEGIAFDEGFAALHVGRSPNRFRPGGDLAEATRAHPSMVLLHHPVLSGSAADVDEVAAAVHKLRVYAEKLLAG
jgi:dTDP-4-amino-4,6-dideoxygalactose transaminase